MATPQFKRILNALNLQLNNAQTIPFLCGTNANPSVPVDLSSGYTARLIVVPQNPVPNQATEIGASGTWSYGSNGILALTLPFQQLQVDLQTTTGTYVCNISNDGFTTFQTVSSGSFVIT